MKMWRGFVKYFIYSVNFLFTLIALLIIGIGAFAQIKFNQIAATVPLLNVDKNLQYFPYVVILFGVIIFLISFSGCCGASTQIKGLLITYAVFLSILAVLKLAGGVLLIITNFKELIDTELTTAFGKNDGVFQAYEALFECCGTNGPDSYNLPGNVVPYTCCKGYTGKESVTCPKAEAYSVGCLSKVVTRTVMMTRNTAIALLVVMGFEVMLLGLTIYLIMTLKPKTTAVESPTTKEN